jgi:hypothetical protein
MRFPVVLSSAKGIASFIGVASKPSLEIVAAKAIEILSLDNTDDGDAGAVNATDRTAIWDYLSARFRHHGTDADVESDGSLARATRQLANARIIRTAFGFVTPSDAFVGTNASVRAAFTGIEMWDEAQSHACAQELQGECSWCIKCARSIHCLTCCDLLLSLSLLGTQSQATQIISDYGGDSNKLIEQLGGKTLEGASSTESFFSQLLLVNAEQLEDRPQALCCLIGGSLKHSAASHEYVPKLRAAPLLKAVDRHADLSDNEKGGEKGGEMVHAASAYFVDGNEPLLIMANPQFTVPVDGLPVTCAFVYEMLGTKSVSDSILLQLAHAEGKEPVDPVSIPEFDRAIRRRSELLLFALGQKIKFTRARRWEAEILQNTKSLLSLVTVFFVPELQQELVFEERKLAVQETSSLYEKSTGRIFLSGSKSDFELVSRLQV